MVALLQVAMDGCTLVSGNFTTVGELSLQWLCSLRCLHRAAVWLHC